MIGKSIEYTSPDNRAFLQTGSVLDKIRYYQVVDVYQTRRSHYEDVKPPKSVAIAVDYYLVLPENSLIPILIHPLDVKQMHDEEKIQQ